MTTTRRSIETHVPLFVTRSTFCSFAVSLPIESLGTRGVHYARIGFLAPSSHVCSSIYLFRYPRRKKDFFRQTSQQHFTEGFILYSYILLFAICDRALRMYFRDTSVTAPRDKLKVAVESGGAHIITTTSFFFFLSTPPFFPLPTNTRGSYTRRAT